jgi:hypothetical protein
MARLLTLTKPAQFGTLSYVVDRAVGEGRPNQRDDVLLVQFFLRTLGPRTVTGTTETYQPAGQPQIAIDGVCGTRTIAAIKNFQTQFNKTQKSPTSGFALLTDGVVDTLNNGGLFGPRQGHLLTIVRLNTEYVFQFGLDKHKRIDTDPLFPPELFGKLFLRNG